MDFVKKHSILIIDDEKPHLNVLIHILNQEYTLYTAKDGQTGLDIAFEFVPDIILLDIILPDINGYEVITHLKASETTKHIPVIFITGLVSGENVKKGMAMGAADYIPKPFSATTVREKVKAQIDLL